MSKSAVRGAVYDPPEPLLPYVALIITPEGSKRIETYSSRADAVEFVRRYVDGYVDKFSVVGRGLDQHDKSKSE